MDLGQQRSDMTTGRYRRLSGVLRMIGHSPVLETPDEEFIKLLTSDDLGSFDGIHVVVEGRMPRVDRFTLEWIGRAPD